MADAPDDAQATEPGGTGPGGHDAPSGSSAPTISTHVLDAEHGQPAAGILVSLYKLGEDDRPIRLTQAMTDADGRIRDLLERPMSPGDYRLEFALAGPPVASAGGGDGGSGTDAPAVNASSEDRFFRRMSIDLRITDTSRSYHVPLLLSPFSMTTYRGS